MKGGAGPSRREEDEEDDDEGRRDEGLVIMACLVGELSGEPRVAS